MVDFVQLYVAPKKFSNMGNSRCALVSFAATQYPSSQSKDDLLAFIGYHDPYFTVNTTPTNYFEAAPAPSFSPDYLSFFPKEYSAVFFVRTETEEEGKPNNIKTVLTGISRNWGSEKLEKLFSPKSNLIEVKVTISKK